MLVRVSPEIIIVFVCDDFGQHSDMYDGPDDLVVVCLYCWNGLSPLTICVHNNTRHIGIKPSIKQLILPLVEGSFGKICF